MIDKESLIVIALAALLLILHFLTRRKSAILRMAWGAVTSEKLYIPEDQGPGVPEMGEHIRVANSKISILYWRKEHESDTAETIDFLVPEHQGFFIITFRNGQPAVWTESGIKRRLPRSTQETYRANQILCAAREAAQKK